VMFVTRENRISSMESPYELMDCSCGKSMGLGSGPVASWVKCLNVLRTFGNGHGKPST
jgi:hypothetical protein